MRSNSVFHRSSLSISSRVSSTEIEVVLSARWPRTWRTTSSVVPCLTL